MNKKKNLIIVLILVIVLFLIYFIFFNKNYSVTIYKYEINDKRLISSTKPTEGIVIDKYNLKCKKECKLITFNYDSTFFALKNDKEGYIYDILSGNFYNIGPFDEIKPIYSKQKDNTLLRVGYILTKQDKTNAFFNNAKEKITIPWTDKYTLGSLLINNKYIETTSGKIFIDVYTGKIHEIKNEYNSYECYTSNTCVFYENNGHSFIYDFDLGDTYKYDYNVLINYTGGAIVEKNSKIYALDFKTTKTTYLMDKPNLSNHIYGNYLTHPNYVSENEIFITFHDKLSCKAYIYDTSLDVLRNEICKTED